MRRMIGFILGILVGVAGTLYFNHYNGKTDYSGKGSTESLVGGVKGLVDTWTQPKKDK